VSDDRIEAVAVALHRRGESVFAAWEKQNESVRTWYREWAEEIVVALAAAGYRVVSEEVFVAMRKDRPEPTRPDPVIRSGWAD
jgi:predicted NBD/HSP70 family sugar kinase